VTKEVLKIALGNALVEASMIFQNQTQDQEPTQLNHNIKMRAIPSLLDLKMLCLPPSIKIKTLALAPIA
jgi:hypothetical protein